MAVTADDLQLEMPAGPEVATFMYRNFEIIRTLLSGGVSGTFTTTDGKTVTVTLGIITDIT